jgi:hypothetical protein
MKTFEITDEMISSGNDKTAGKSNSAFYDEAT